MPSTRPKDTTNSVKESSMCGIWAYISRGSSSYPNYTKGVETLKARGPESTFVGEYTHGIWAFTRLAINGLNDEGMQPFFLPDNSVGWMCNGEIYNALMLEKEYNMPVRSGSDCETIGHLYCIFDVYEAGVVPFVQKLDGEFAFVLRDEELQATIVARDPYGVRPLFWGTGSDGGLFFGSERKSIQDYVEETFAFPPGEVWTITDGAIKKERYHHNPCVKLPLSVDPAPLVRAALEEAVLKRVMTSERPVAALLSGGLDSSLVCAIAQRVLTNFGRPPLQTFSIGMEGSTDLEYARKVAKHIRSVHTEISVTADQMFSVIPQVIHGIESYDITTVRASVGNWLCGQYIRENTPCKVVLNGDGSDEVWGSYKYFRRAPSDDQFDLECGRLLDEIHLYDVLRSDRSISCHGLEPRTPFLDKAFVAVALSVPTDKRRNDKQLLREAFVGDWLPDEVLWREKEAFSDGVSSVEKSWFQEIKDRVKDVRCCDAIPNPPTAEARWYRSVFNEHFPNIGDPWPYWMPRWSPETNDPSARTLAEKK